MPDLFELCVAATEAAEGDEQVEAYGEERSTTSVEAHRGEVEGLTFAESRGVGVRLISQGRLGYAYAADPSIDEVREAVSRARENAAVASPDEFNVLPAAEPIEPLEGLFSDALAGMTTEEKVPIALELERAATTTDPRVRKIEAVRYGDAVCGVAIASTGGVAPSTARPDAGSSSSRSPSTTATRRPASRSASRGGSRTSTGTAWWTRRSSGARGCSVRRSPPRPASRSCSIRSRRHVPGRAGRRLVGRGRAEAAIAVRAAGRRAGGLRRAHARGRRPAARRAGGGAVRRRGGPDRSYRAAHVRRPERVPPQHVHGPARRDPLHRQRGARLPIVAGRRHVEPLRPAGRSVARPAAPRGGGRGPRAGRHRRPLRREPDQRRVLGRRDRPADLGRQRSASPFAR